MTSFIPTQIASQTSCDLNKTIYIRLRKCVTQGKRFTYFFKGASFSPLSEIQGRLKINWGAF